MDTPAGFISKKVALHILGRYLIFGPLIGGAPYVWTIIAIPFAYALGIGPAVICGLLTLWWLTLGGTRAALPGPWHAAAFGALFGAVSAVATQVALLMWERSTFDVLAVVDEILKLSSSAPLPFVLPHAVAAGAIMAAWTVKRLARPTEQLPVNTLPARA